MNVTNGVPVKAVTFDVLASTKPTVEQPKRIECVLFHKRCAKIRIV